MQLLTEQEVKTALEFFNFRQPPPFQRSPDEMDILIKVVFDDLLEERWSSERFALACRRHRKYSKYLPDTPDLLKADKAVADAVPYRELAAIPAWETDVDSQCARNIEGAKRILEKLGREKRMPA